MIKERPIVCSLDGSSMKGRVADWAALGRKGLVKRDPHASGVILHYRADSEVGSELERLIALEGDCCEFLTFELTTQTGELVLTVTGPEDAVPIIRQCWSVMS